MLVIPTPTYEHVVDELIAVVRADVQAVDSLINAQLPSGVTFDVDTVSMDGNDPGEYQQIKYGDRQTPPRGLSLCFIPISADPDHFSSGPIDKQVFAMAIRWYWNDPATGERLTEKPGLYSRMITKLAQALQVVLGMTNLGAVSGAWNIDGGRVFDPRTYMSMPCYPIKDEHRQQLILLSEIRWRGFITYGNP